MAPVVIVPVFVSLPAKVIFVEPLRLTFFAATVPSNTVVSELVTVRVSSGPPEPTSPLRVIVPVPARRVKDSTPPPATVPSVRPVIFKLPAPAPPVDSVIAAASNRTTLPIRVKSPALVVISAPAVKLIVGACRVNDFPAPAPLASTSTVTSMLMDAAIWTLAVPIIVTIFAADIEYGSTTASLARIV